VGVFEEVTARRIAENQATFRDANERIEDAAREHDVVRPPFICECPNERCTETVRADIADYERIRSNPLHFLVVPGHETAAESYARVVHDAGSYRVVEKLGEAGDVAVSRDPRAA
jgi:hypothetical protein